MSHISISTFNCHQSAKLLSTDKIVYFTEYMVSFNVLRYNTQVVLLLFYKSQ